ncbi:MAG: NifB/NifX family molybdenum-iron cluster-binding protein [Desulfomonilia bacterium]
MLRTHPHGSAAHPAGRAEPGAALLRASAGNTDTMGAKKRTKNALPSTENMVDSHLGHCEHFTVVTVDDRKKIVSKEIVQPPAGCGCKSNMVSILAGMGVRVMPANVSGAANVLALTASRLSAGAAAR